MKRRHSLLPPSLNGLKVFESAARHLSFTLAADELNVTQSAVSRQIRQLEEHLGYALFIRHHRALELSNEGKEISLLLTRQYSELNHQLQQLKSQQTQTLRVKVAMSFAVRWLIPRLHSFKQRYPELDIVVSSSMGHNSEELRLEDDDYDIAIYNMKTDQKSRYQQHFIRKEYLAPVYSQLLTHSPETLTVEQLLTYPRLHPTPDQSDWKVWLERNQRKSAASHRGITFNTLDMALTSCFAGQGVTMTDLMLVVHELKEGYLHLPQHGTIIANDRWHYYFHNTIESDAVTQFVDWMLEEQERDKAALFALANERDWRIID
ncbi:glycine cleavage system transcriptional activator [Photobacterium aphoticum]|uniref:Glycine cleavage system transcriptional activator n=1 Tax=Photobacterium aphoticum TaxID=754436 RepID=A0A090QJF6_9GAMM|nr:glycine cleavage system transcriptional activator [Photobacterium aphoticum]